MSSLSETHNEADSPLPMTAVAPGRPDAPSHPASLLARAQTGDREAFAQIVRLYQDRLYNAILRLVGNRDDAADLTQEAFTHALDKIGSFRGEAGVYTWLFRIAANLALSRMRRDQRRKVFSLDGSGRSNGHGGNGQPRARANDDQSSGLIDRVTQDAGPAPAEAMEQRERSEQVEAALGRLDPESRALLVMRDVEGFDYQQMAEVLGMPLGTLKSRLFRARLALREQLKSYMET